MNDGINTIIDIDNMIAFSQMINTIFENSPKDISTYSIKSTTRMFPILMEILITGAKKLYGEDITPSQLTYEQFNILQKYIMSIGYKVMYNYTENINGKIINVWFEEIKKVVDCKGNTFYK